MKKPDYSMMGCKVVVTHQLVRHKDAIEGGVIEWVSVGLKEPRIGWVVGYRHLNNGTYSNSSAPGYSNDWAGGDSPSMKVTSRTPCVLVAWWPTESAFQVPMDGFRRYVLDFGDERFPCYSSSGYGSGEYRR